MSDKADSYHITWCGFLKITPVRSSFHCNFEGYSEGILKQSVEGEEIWNLIAAGVDSTRPSFDHTTLSGKVK